MRNQKGVVWYEVLTVAMIVGIVTAIAIPLLFSAKQKERGRTDFSLYFGVKTPDYEVLDSAQKSVLKPLIEKQLKEFSETSERDRNALTDIFKQPPALDAAQAQERLDAVTKAEASVAFSEEQYRRALFSAQLYGLAEK